jgi:hypothetical protein
MKLLYVHLVKLVSSYTQMDLVRIVIISVENVLILLISALYVLILQEVLPHNVNALMAISEILLLVVV